MISFGFMRNKDRLFGKNDLIWKAFSKVGVFYCAFLIFIYFNKIEDVREILDLFSDRKNYKEGELYHHYTYFPTDCTLKNVDWKEVFLNKYYFSHLIGWLFHAFIIKDYYMSWTWGILNEILGNFYCYTNQKYTKNL